MRVGGQTLTKVATLTNSHPRLTRPLVSFEINQLNIKLHTRARILVAVNFRNVYPCRRKKFLNFIS